MSEQDMIDKVLLFDVLVRKFKKEIITLNRKQGGIKLKNPMIHDSRIELFNTTDGFIVEKGNYGRYFVTNIHMNYTSYVPSHIMEENDIAKFTEAVRSFCYDIYLHNLSRYKDEQKMALDDILDNIKKVDNSIDYVKKFFTEGDEK